MFEMHDERIVQMMLDLDKGRMGTKQYEKFILRVGSVPIILMILVLLSFQPDFIIPEWFGPVSVTSLIISAAVILWAGFGEEIQIRNIARSFPVEAEEYLKRRRA